MQPLHKDQLRLGERLVVFLLYVGTVSLIYNQRIGWEDSDGPNWFALVLRPEIWFAITIVFGLIIIPKLTLWPRGRIGAAKTVLWSAPVAMLLAALFASALSAINYNQAFDYFGSSEFAESVLCIGVGVLVFNLALVSSRFASTMINLLTWSPLITVIVAILAMILLVGDIHAFDQYLTDINDGRGFVGESGRFQGISSHPNLVFIQCGIALALVIPRILQPAYGRLWMRALLFVYAVALAGAIVWSAVRAALVVIPVVFLILVWLHFRLTAKSLLEADRFFAMSGVFFVFVWLVVWSLDLAEVLFERLLTDDGRVFLWLHYLTVLSQNPLGLGFAFETIANTDLIVEGQRLPPHNALIQAGMYGGVVSVMVSLFLLGKVGLIIARLRRSMRRGKQSVELLGVILAWSTLVLALMFGGSINADFRFAILTALLLALSARPVPQSGSELLPASQALL